MTERHKTYKQANTHLAVRTDTDTERQRERWTYACKVTFSRSMHTIDIRKITSQMDGLGINRGLKESFARHLLDVCFII